MTDMNRRRFLKASATVAVGAAALTGPYIAAGKASANGRIRAAQFTKQYGRKLHTVTDMRRLFDDKHIDVVTFATPNHWHALGTVWACQAGKDVYCEKPAAHGIDEGRKMVDAARKYGRIVQIGTQCRSSHNIREGIQRLHDGVIGDLYMARGVAYKLRESMGQPKEEPVPEGMDWDK